MALWKNTRFSNSETPLIGYVDGLAFLSHVNYHLTTFFPKPVDTKTPKIVPS